MIAVFTHELESENAILFSATRDKAFYTRREGEFVYSFQCTGELSPDCSTFYRDKDSDEFITSETVWEDFTLQARFLNHKAMIAAGVLK